MEDFFQPSHFITIDRSTLQMIPPERRAEYVAQRVKYALSGIDLLEGVSALTVQVK
jgi:hypothetical protein